jgi:hypothetical protein
MNQSPKQDCVYIMVTTNSWVVRSSDKYLAGLTLVTFERALGSRPSEVRVL